MPHPVSPCIRAQGEATGLAQVCMLGAILQGLLLILSPVTPPPLSPQMCSELDVQDPELLHSSNRTAPASVSWEGDPPFLTLTRAEHRAGPGWWVGTGWEVSVVLACKLLTWVFDIVSWGLQVPECNVLCLISDWSCLEEVALGCGAVHLGTCRDAELLPSDLSLAGVVRMWMKGYWSELPFP